MNGAHSSFVDAGGVSIHARTVSCAASKAPPVVILHGFTGSTESMRGVVTELCQTRETVCIDLVGHGRSDAPRQPGQYTMDRCAEQVATVVEALALRRPHMLGYSMGGRAALACCANFPERVRSAMLIGASAGLTDPDARRARIEEDESLADRIIAQGLEAFVEEWMAKPVFASQGRRCASALAELRAEKLHNLPHGLALSLLGMGTGAMSPIELIALRVPTCFVAGAQDKKFSTIAREYADTLPDSRCEIVADAGHAVHLENQEELGRVARDYFAEIDAETN